MEECYQNTASSSEICTCAYCGVHIPWGGVDEQKGVIWSCEKCGKDFCQKCFLDRHGAAAYRDMVSNEDLTEEDNILCPSCYASKHSDIA